MKRTMCLAIATLMMSGCGSKTVAVSNADKSQQTKAQETTQAQTLSKGEELAKQYTGFIETPMDLGGREIKLVSTVGGRYKYSDPKDKTPNDTLEVMDHLKSIEKEYNCKITIESMKGKNMVESLLAAKAAGKPYCDILEFGVSDTYLEQIYANNLVMPLEEGEAGKIINLSKNPWRPQSGFGKLMGHQYGVNIKTNNSGELLRGVLLFNKDLAKKYDLGDFYDLVKKDQWTFEKFSEILAKASAQTAGSDVYPLGYLYEADFTPLLVYANNGTYAENTNEGYKYTALSDNVLEATNFGVDLIKKGYTHPKSGLKNAEIDTPFADGKMIFYFAEYNLLKMITSGTLPSEYNFGILPAPRGPKGKGYNSVSYTDSLFHVMNNVEKPEQVAAVLTAIANRTSKKDILNTELKYTLQDEQSGEMLTLMYNNVTLDYARGISTARGTIAGANKKILSLEQTPKEAYESIQDMMQAYYNDVKVQKE
jgi:ABC-type glycerol-3-phosphate transport system substrate-binding protein